MGHGGKCHPDPTSRMKDLGPHAEGASPRTLCPAADPSGHCSHVLPNSWAGLLAHGFTDMLQ